MVPENFMFYDKIPVVYKSVDNVKQFTPITYKSSFQQCIKSTLQVGQFFGLMPVQGVSSKNTYSVKFTFFSFKTIYAFLSCWGQMFMTSLAIANLSIATSYSLGSITPVFFYTTTLLTMVMFFRLAGRWPKLTRYIARVEDLDPSIDSGLSFRCNVTCTVVLTFSLMEHTMSIVPWILQANSCYPPKRLDSYDKIVLNMYPWIFDWVPFSVTAGAVCQVQSTFVWNFSDLFVIIMSMYLVSRINQVNEKLFVARGKRLPDSFWRSAREEYGRAAQLVRRADEAIGAITFVSFANNLFYICLQLFYTLENGLRGKLDCKRRVRGSGLLSSYMTAAYFIFSLVFLISRSLAVSLAAAQVHVAALAAVPVLYDVPHDSYGIEVQRFLAQACGGKVALSGLQFFSITRGLLLTIAGTIVTYELVMYQFNYNASPLADASTTVAYNDSLDYEVWN